MTQGRIKIIVLSTLALLVAVFSFSGCKGQQQVQQAVSDLDAKVAENQRRMNAMDSEIKKLSFELNQLKVLVTKLGNVTVDLQKAEEARASKHAKALGGKSKSPVKKTSAKPGAKKKRH
ncbi:MAG: hypothetical protein AB1540_14085 [Bdellovibrionota bacterium]